MKNNLVDWSLFFFVFLEETLVPHESCLLIINPLSDLLLFLVILLFLLSYCQEEGQIRGGDCGGFYELKETEGNQM